MNKEEQEALARKLVPVFDEDKKRFIDLLWSELPKMKAFADQRLQSTEDDLTTIMMEFVHFENNGRPYDSWWETVMSYQCDICSSELLEKSHGKYFDRNQVLTSPSFWKFLMTEGVPLGRLDSERMLAMNLSMRFQMNDTSGYLVCKKCAEKIFADIELRRKHGMSEHWVKSIPSGQIDRETIVYVAGTVWETVHGSWPSCIKISTSESDKSADSNKKWWQFWK